LWSKQTMAVLAAAKCDAATVGEGDSVVDMPVGIQIGKPYFAVGGENRRRVHPSWPAIRSLRTSRTLIR
jgi:hypothetical protein